MQKTYTIYLRLIEQMVDRYKKYKTNEVVDIYKRHKLQIKVV